MLIIRYVVCITCTHNYIILTLIFLGIYPLVAWDIKNSITFTAEASSITVGTCIDWLKSTGIIQDVSSTSDIAKSVPDTNGCYFVPAFAGLPVCALFTSLLPPKQNFLASFLSCLKYSNQKLFI